MPGKYAWIALGVGAYVAFALSTFPAAAAYRLLGQNELRLTGIEGTVWSGRAALGSAAGLPMQDIRWSLDAAPLLLGRLSGQVEARLSDGFIETAVSASPARVLLTELSASTSIAALRPMLPVEGVGGLLNVTMARVRLDGGRPTEAVGEARIADLTVPPLMPSGASGPIPLGNFELVFAETDGNGIAADIRDAGGPLELSGRLVLDPAGNYEIEALAAARGDAAPELVQGLALMSEERPDGKRRLSLVGSL